LARERTAQVLQQRKRMKRRLTLFAERFNSDDSLKKFLPYAQELGLLPSGPLATLDPGDVAKLLKATPGLDKAQVRGAVRVDCGYNDPSICTRLLCLRGLSLVLLP
jgi:hypothetical protein